ncbi:hypothetical protein [Paenibacillus roseipurpureus]|uniref:Uncharacterized protein n=1 Tax=Paenibacillus roseopurpureus TaxID=2918901 RepID=A0AA96RM82_9BACL|nr:hypothetical protein [Paenibacillus sp. MBLB1832]WNR46460.1 hypothetical protein MJB10_10325 [Paenibacillus sp. MBLB1832]
MIKSRCYVDSSGFYAGGSTVVTPNRRLRELSLPKSRLGSPSAAM